LPRTRIVSVFGLKGPTAADFNHVEAKSGYAVGDKIARFTLFALSEAEIVTGGNDKHLDFRVLVSRIHEDGVDKVVLSTVVSPHNFFGKAYLFLILPFHKVWREDDHVERRGGRPRLGAASPSARTVAQRTGWRSRRPAKEPTPRRRPTMPHRRHCATEPTRAVRLHRRR
jgi:hypothetical protein